MHEMSLMEEIMSVLDGEAGRQGFARVLKLTLEIGALSTVDPEALRFAFEAIKGSTIARDAALEIRSLPGRAFCMSCARPVVVESRLDPCPLCGGERLQVTGGEEMRIKELEVE